MSVTIKLLYGGDFYLATSPYPCLCYRKKSEFKKVDVDPDLLSRIELESFVKDDLSMDVKELWYCKAGLNLNRGLEEIKVDRDILELCKSGGNNNTLDVYVITTSDLSPHSLLDFANGRAVQPNAFIGSPPSKVMKVTQSIGPSLSIGIDKNLASQIDASSPQNLPEIDITVTTSPPKKFSGLATPKAPRGVKFKSVPIHKQRVVASTSRKISYEDEVVDDDVDFLVSESSESDDSYVLSSKEKIGRASCRERV